MRRLVWRWICRDEATRLTYTHDVMVLQAIFYIVSPFGQDGFALLHGDVIRRDLTAAAGIKRIDRDNRKRRSGSKKDRHVAD